MKYLKYFESSNYNDAKFFIEVTYETALSYCEGNPIPSSNPIPRNEQILSYAFNIPISVLSVEELDDAITECCHWYDGTNNSIKDGVNAVNDFDYASEGPDFVLGINTDSECAYFGDLHVFIKDYRKINVLFVYDCKTEKYYSTNNFKLNYEANKFNI